MAKTRFTILGAGAWGTAIGIVLAQQPEHEIYLWSARPENARELHQRRENVRLLPGIPIPPAIHLTTDIQEALAEVDLVVLGIPTVHLRSTLERIAGAVAEACPVISLAKGLEKDTFLRPSEIVEQVWGSRPVVVLSGPSHAEEVARFLPTTVVAACADMELAKRVQNHFTTDRFRVYTNGDVIGVELAGAIKNIIGIAAGICDGLGFGDNAKAALLTRGVAEMARFGIALGAQPDTFGGLAGMGDLITTCISKFGRNRQVGMRLAQGEKVAAILGSMNMIAEGVFTTQSVHDKAQNLQISMPITAEVYRVLYEDKDPRQAVNALMLREPTSER